MATCKRHVEKVLQIFMGGVANIGQDWTETIDKLQKVVNDAVMIGYDVTQ